MSLWSCLPARGARLVGCPAQGRYAHNGQTRQVLSQAFALRPLPTRSRIASQENWLTPTFLELLALEKTWLKTWLIGLLPALFLATLLRASSCEAAGVFIDGVPVNCVDAAKYRDHDLFIDLETAFATYDAHKEQRIKETLDRFNADTADLRQQWDQADLNAKKKIAAAAVAVLLGEVAAYKGEHLLVGARKLSSVEKQALRAVAERGGNWIEIFSKYSVTGEVDLASLGTMPISILLEFVDQSIAVKTLKGGLAAIDIATEIGDRVIAQDEYEKNSQVLTHAAQKLLSHSQVIQITQINAIKNEIDGQCGTER